MRVEVCLTPNLIEQHELSNKIAVVVDIFRATSCMITGLANDVNAIYPVATVAECLAMGKQGMIMAGERGGEKIAEFDIGNSPFEYLSETVKGKDVAVTTTNGTLAISKSDDAHEVLIGSFLNLSVLATYLQQQARDVVIHCAGWKGTPNLEDTLFAGALIDQLNENDISLINDGAHLALSTYEQHRHDLLAAGKSSSHAQRLASFGVTKDIAFCLEVDKYKVLVKMEGKKLVQKNGSPTSGDK